jgi:hypothetical protein
MQQTLLSLLALLIVTFFSFSQQQTNIRSQKQAVRAELEQMALGVGMQTMEVIRSRTFDANVSGGGGDYADPEEFTPESNFGSGGNCRLRSYDDMPENPHGNVSYEGGADCENIEEFDQTVADVPHPLPNGETYPFEVEVEVRYVCSDLNPPGETTDSDCTTPTSRKEVILKIQDIPPAGQQPRLPEIRYTEVITYP